MNNVQKYKIVKSEGCTAFYLEINGKDWHCEDKRYEFKEKEEFIDYLLDHIKKSLNDGTVLIDHLIEVIQADDYEYDDNICDQCGDTVTRTIWNI